MSGGVDMNNVYGFMFGFCAGLIGLGVTNWLNRRRAPTPKDIIETDQQHAEIQKMEDNIAVTDALRVSALADYERRNGPLGGGVVVRPSPEPVHGGSKPASKDTPTSG